MKDSSHRQISLFDTPMELTQPVAAQPATPAQEPAPKIHRAPISHPKPAPAKDPLDAMYVKIVGGLKDFFKQRHFKKAVVGLSGGVDSALTLKIAVDALGAEHVTALIMPELGLTKGENIDHAKILCEFFGVTYYYQPINNFMMDFTITPWKPTNHAIMNSKSRIRSVLLYNYANSHGALVLGTSNKSELLLGYGTKFGDLAADVEVIADLFKTQVVKLANHIGLPPEIVYKTPSAELAPGQTDEDEIGATYADLDKVLAKRELGVEGCVEHGLPMALVQLVFRRMAENAHKLELPTVLSAH